MKLSDKLISDYNAVITDLKKSDDIIDTRAADGFENYMSSEILIPFGVYLLLFSIFSSEIQSSRIKSFGITKTGVRKFSLFKLCTGFVAVIILVLIIYTVDIITLFIYDTNGFKLDMPLQYLSGFELSSANMSCYVSFNALQKDHTCRSCLSCANICTIISENHKSFQSCR